MPPVREILQSFCQHCGPAALDELSFDPHSVWACGVDREALRACSNVERLPEARAFTDAPVNRGQISMRGVEDGESGEPWHADVEEARVGEFVDGIWCGISNSLAMQAWRCLLTSS